MTYTGQVLIADLDSPTQRERFVHQSEPGAAIAELTGMIRVARLISERILITDAMLLDGNYFMSLGPAGVLQELGTNRSDFPFIVTGTAPSLRQWLESRLENAEFAWSLLELSDRERPSTHLLSRWEDWIALTENGTIRYVVQSGDADMVFGEPPALAGVDQLLAELRDTNRRSDAWAKIDCCDRTADEKNLLREWWNVAYLQLIAAKAGADWISFSQNRAQRGKIAQNVLRVPKKLIVWATESSPATIALAWDATLKLRADFNRRPSWVRLRNLAYGSTEVIESPSRRMVLAESVIKVVIACVVLIFALPGVSESEVYKSYVWLIFGFGVLTTLPYRAIKNLVSLMTPDDASIIVTYPREQPRIQLAEAGA